ncbi:M56 family metallopeptidase [Alloacidobacterium dinghuense]|uniref:M56 family metallopeptidase n=1 Tax=Alloacidobacterium dinghuense TaxID=2763107 RepID=A0A7G8BP01_9BACT|nr:M56 family metallopeptidase [Alloacidobacterium dinghuense]QNI34271.1 M56 family metallopeptidase [Alloacidobacterium dinghuense]
MNWFAMQSVAQVAVERVVNSLPEGILVALFAWLLLRLIGRQNSGTRFAVWFMALLAVVCLSLAGGWKLDVGTFLPAISHLHSQIVVPAVWAVILLSSWAIVSTLAIARLLAGLWQVWAIRRSSKEIDLSQLDPNIQKLFQNHSRMARLAVSDRVKVPAAIGFWKPAIVLPSWTQRELAPDELKPILIHELTHLNRRDDWTNLLQKIVRAVFFFHPAVWWIDARLSIEREMACDDAVLANTGNARAYASCLIDLLEKSCERRGWTMAQAAVHRAKDLSLRITRILDAKRPSTTRVWKPALALTSVFSLACLCLSYCTPQLVAFGPAAHNTKEQADRHAEDQDLIPMQGMVIPASYHPPAPTPKALNAPVNHKPVKRPHQPKAVTPKLATTYKQKTTPNVMLAKAVEPLINQQPAPMIQMVMFIESTTYGQPCNSGNPQTSAPRWNTRILQIVFITSAQNAAQTEVLSSQI